MIYLSDLSQEDHDLYDLDLVDRNASILRVKLCDGETLIACVISCWLQYQSTYALSH